MKKSEKSPFYGGTCFFVPPAARGGRKLTIDYLQLTIERQRGELGLGVTAAPSGKMIGRGITGMIGFQDENPLLVNPLNPLIIVIPLQSAGAPEHYRLWVEPWGHTRKISHTREKRWSRNVTVGKLSSYSFGSLEKRVPVTSRRVPVSHLRVPVASECTPGASQRVPMGSELCVWARNPRANVTFSSEMQSWLSCRGNLWEMRYGS